ncbi:MULTISPECIES: TetR/AcrR family transcriptional regulator [Devosia]|jgi:AcrR family transcriptional regulator|uniref:TetR/AcrR family transcriptional regulator n=1 Tax=Devosia litorisediminis TaxID=2829817 RepID=A0A942E8V1_9HYPH|nr:MULTISPECIES: TetR/AcrR family transcriptional regulator [Devosia]MBS3850393.1 TetR/AcrR family transcriptional regulator [Devosia litorisediminis]MCZ4347435.1 TetR/AcrR family transcriptional regulator [Devosia neptuniae]|tara:strand:- start:332 stop:892 length:561 start_codon:yes stop_codon:yes gene_type:complete
MSTSANAPYHHGDLRRALLDAALIILERDGEAGLGLRDLARAVGVSPAAPYRHFDSRAALLEALAVTGYQRFTTAMNEVAASNPPDILSAMGKTYVLFALNNTALFRLMFSPQLKRDNRPGLRMAANAAFDTLRQVSGGDNPGGRIAALAAWARVHGLAVLLLDGQIAIQAGEDIEALITEIIEKR